MRQAGLCKSAVFLAVYIFATYLTMMMFTSNNKSPSQEHTTDRVLNNEGPGLSRNQLLARVKQLSRDLNAMQEKHQQLWCRVHNNKNASETGGYCDYEVNIGHKTDHSLAAALIKFFTNRTVISLGDGPGVYCTMMRAAGIKYDAYDGSPNISKLTQGRVSFLDLTLPQYWLEPHDWAISLEVIEHIPAQYESTVIDNIVRVAREGVVLSWAVPGQPGFYHVNNQPHAHVDDVMRQRSFIRDEFATKTMKNASSLPWFKSNLIVYRRQGNLPGHSL